MIAVAVTGLLMLARRNSEVGPACRLVFSVQL